MKIKVIFGAGIIFLLFFAMQNLIIAKAITCYLQEGIEAPQFNLKDLNGQEISLSGFRNKKQVLVFFWITECYACEIEIKKLIKLYPHLQEKNIEILGVNVGESEEKVISYVKRRWINFSVVLDSDYNVARRYKIIGFPTLVLVDINGTINFIENDLPRQYQN